MKRMNTSVSLLFRLLIRPQFHFNCTFIELVLDRMQRHARCSDLCLTWWSCQTLNVGLFLGRCLSYLFQSRHCIHTCALKAQSSAINRPQTHTLKLKRNQPILVVSKNHVVLTRCRRCVPVSVCVCQCVTTF